VDGVEQRGGVGDAARHRPGSVLAGGDRDVAELDRGGAELDAAAAGTPRRRRPSSGSGGPIAFPRAGSNDCLPESERMNILLVLIPLSLLLVIAADRFSRR